MLQALQRLGENCQISEQIPYNKGGIILDITRAGNAHMQLWTSSDGSRRGSLEPPPRPLYPMRMKQPGHGAIQTSILFSLEQQEKCSEF